MHGMDPGSPGLGFRLGSWKRCVDPVCVDSLVPDLSLLIHIIYAEPVYDGICIYVQYINTILYVLI